MMEAQPRLLFVAISIGLLLAGAGATSADEVLFFDDFESDTAGLAPTSDDLDPAIGAGDIGGNWVNIETGTETNLQVRNDDPFESGTPGANNYLRINRVSGQSLGRPWATGWDPADTLNQVVTVELSLYRPSGQDNDFGMTAFNNTSFVNTGADFTNRAWDVGFRPDGTIYYYDGANGVDINSIAYQLDAWQDVVLVANMATQTATLTIEGNTASETIVWNSGVDEFAKFLPFSPGGGSNFFTYGDNVRLSSSIPEPTNLWLLNIGALGVAICRWRGRTS